MATCAPAVHADLSKSGRCLRDDDVMSIVKHWNTHRPSKRIRSNIDIKTMLEKLKRLLGPDHSRWSDHKVMKRDRELQHTVASRYRPKRPSSWKNNPTKWLSTPDIERVMRQYEDAHADFKFLGVHPRDFTVILYGSTCIAGKRVCSPDFDDGFKHIGVVFNMDRHDQSGSHWVACFISIDASKAMYGAYYYDSLARPPPPEIAAWMLQVKRDVERRTRTTRAFEVSYNRGRRQFKNTECGMFAMVFLTQSIANDRTFEVICEEMGSDQDMIKQRRIMYRS